MLQLRSISKSYQADGHTIGALKEVSCELGAGQFCAVRGKSGSGKSTLLLAAGGLLRPDAGQVLLDGQDVYGMSAEQRAAFRATKVGFVFQQFHLVPYLGLLDNVLTAVLGLRSSQADARTRARMLVERFGLADRIGHRPSQLSTGERQRTALARALLNGPRLLLADEPTGNLDEENSETVLECLAQFARDGGAVLLATHDAQAATYADTHLLLADGVLQPS